MEKFKNFINSISQNSFINSIFFLFTFLNTSYLLYSSFTNKPKLKSKPISKHGNHMIWTIFPDTFDSEDRQIRTYAFIPYMQVYNIGKKPVELDEWTLSVKDKSTSNYINLDISPIPSAIQYLSDGSAIKYEMLGMNDNVGAIQPGSSMSGLSLYVAQYFINPENIEEHGIVINDDYSINGKFKIKDIFGKTNEKQIIFKYQSYDKVQEVMPNIDKSIYKEGIKNES